MQNDELMSAAKTNTGRIYLSGVFIAVLFSSQFKHRESAGVSKFRAAFPEVEQRFKG